MSTPVHLASVGQVTRWEPALRPKEQALRAIYLLPRALRWLTDELPDLEATWNLEVDPAEELDAFVNMYFRGEVLVFERQVRPIRHISAGIWELKTTELRLFGWFFARDIFMCSSVDSATRIKKHRLYEGYRDQAVRDRIALDLDAPKFVPGDEISHVLSNCT